jgi:hypothetical protein
MAGAANGAANIAAAIIHVDDVEDHANRSGLARGDVVALGRIFNR